METIDHRGGKSSRSSSSRRIMIHDHFSCTLSADIILSRLPVDSVLRCRHVCKTWRTVIDDPLRRISMISNFLPAYIIINILSRLPADSIIQHCRCVCKTWRTLIDHPSFAETHTGRLISSSSSLNNDQLIMKKKGTTIGNLFQCAYQTTTNDFGLHFVEYNDDNAHNNSLLKGSEPITHLPFALDYDKWGLIRLSSCNGLVFIGSSKPDVNDVFVCNPFTREYVNLLRSTYHKADDDGDCYMVYGFGYHSSSNVYKVISIYFRGRNDAPGVVSVYTLGSGNGWRNKGEIPYKFFCRRPGMLANGAIHWMNKNDDNYKIIVSFDLADEKFRIVPSPPAPPSSNHVDQLGVLGGCLCVTRSNKTRFESPKNIWVLNIHKELEEGKDQYSWNKKFSIPWKYMLSNAEPRAIMPSGRILCGFFKYIISYDPKTKEGKCFDQNWLQRGGNCWTEIVPYMKTFVSLKALGEEDAKCFHRRASRPA